jgi:Rrf2 family protein
MLSQTAEYALRAMVHLAREGEERDVSLPADEIAHALTLPGNYLSKILHSLAREGLLRSTRGPNGGFRLAAPADELALGRIVAVFDSELLAEDGRCLLGQEVCSDENACPAHAHWKQVSQDVRTFFSATTLRQLAVGPAAAQMTKLRENGGPGGGSATGRRDH